MAKDERVHRFRRAAAKLPAGQARRYSQELRELALDYAGEQKAEGASLVQIAAELGVPVQTLSLWRGRRGAMRPVRLSGDAEPRAADKEADGLVVTTAEGFRIEGLTEARALELLRGLR